jgi:uncharacterized protein (TIGR03000 family)
MYSVVLMAALTTGGTAPDCHFRGGCCGCYGGCYGGWGGCYGGWGGCYGGCYGWGGCYGGGYGGCWGGYGGWGYGMGYGVGGYGVGGSGMGAYGGTVVPDGTTTTPQGEKIKTKPTPDKDKDTMAPSRAKLIVELPPDAKLYIDDLPMKTTSEVRSFNTPVLERGQSYYYMVRAEVIRDGKPVTQTRRVIVRAGQTARANFKDMDTEAVSTARAK